MGQLIKIALADIRENPVALRTVDRQSEQFLGLVESIRAKGFMGAITVREQMDNDTQQKYYELVDGLHRFNASKEAGLTEINADVVSLNEDQVLEAQIMANIHKVETRPIEYTQQLKRILTRNPLMTESELASKLGKSPSWIKERLGLLKITNTEIATLVNEGRISLANAYTLSKLPPEEHTEFVDRAITMKPDEFVPIINARAKEIKEAKRQGADAAPAEFQPTAFLQKLGDIKAGSENSAQANAVCQANNATTAAQGFMLGLKWALHLDSASVAAQKAKDEARKAEREAAKQKRDAEKAAKKLAEGAQAASKAEG